MPKGKLHASLGLWTSISIVVGGIIGSGIFMKPALMASQLGSPVLLVGVWIVAGVITLFGALSNAEISAMIPETGGQYIFFEKMYGHFIAFLYGWSAFIVFNTAGIASIAYVFGTYTEYFINLPRFPADVEHRVELYIPFIGSIFPLENIGVKSLTILVVIGLTYVNYRSTRSGGNIQVVFTALKVLAMGLVVFGLFFSSEGDASHFITSSTTIHPEGWALVGALVAATSGAFWGYDGWNNITFVAGEIRDPQRNIPRSLLLGLLICIGTYTLITLAYLYVLPIDTVAASGMVASDAAQVVMGTVGGGIIALMVIISTFGTTNGNILATARVTFAMGQQKQFFGFAGKVHPTFGTPGNALWLQGIWTSVLVLSGSFDMLTDMLVFMSWVFYGLSAFGIFILRKKMADAHRPYKVWGYPFVPAIFVVFTAFFLVSTLWTDIYYYATGKTHLINSLLGLFLTALGIPLYWFFKRRYASDPNTL
ncbi:APC family permease [Chryseolinea lacunae]|uniref:Amino acid permease n=1 Tax=Chryseolinea lacunae TaxID=2801331 RepID=A0ABS1L0B7_9BACT|nr:amino acid permease [Chryseolinea lacunae]MBL0744953.1 amino acid permease [Chryseolinea lacunae]